MEYVERVQHNLGSLERSEIKTRQQISHTNQELVRATADIELEMAQLKKELAVLQEETKKTIDHVKSAVNGFKTVARKGDLQRLQGRIDVWAPEQKITREQLKKLLDDIA